MQAKYGGGGDFAYAYVIAHEVGHHVQDLLGILDKANAAKQRVSRTQANAISVRIELQADCLAGVWAANANKKWKLIDQDDIRAPSPRPRRSATTACRPPRAATPCPTALPTVRP